MRAMKTVGAIIFLFCFLMMTFSKSFTLFNFYLNQEAITAKFCVNKNKPKMNCNGKCYLAKQIKEQEQREAGNAIMELANIEVFSSASHFAQSLKSSYTIIAIIYPEFSVPLSETFLTNTFKPPCA